ncbi:hypothetical protein A2331_01715 [Candidatus Falkowbacteria bacterium RIFOXYB2_FULL_34_18]|uniref:Glycosyltransferase 2-like domain-containing protein n=1 Tax=Candidatus Falkowbacteria bacterium RIFOXYD2_FULL_34_120 TaxID=1798007 RepID=A0A1F5TPQ2_9BACT|nr:MAG: hypothetical protein A2331_01715 [Candidatus Falkowbacteria bacterium RIFOXYB2_FULL_34_18]OGF29329.1 MAG: hypothetical protein A2500_05595 [Candidatus Falkowbacteria bacterium RIFOXYC12_FULL_34_55]OGF36445.1 MAG: hypothetical protein A2466_01255 [Candidatus Falkowbacteria bacterium RIFOXYC2_FULL_34_220]OGF38924.1 MAG: hypothetical protein A2515_06015 [Candidatus Falkowbacteria bacterium RIFOXYD12_FULL_34_57]OGF40943.1 MAG: hypothetical protein A2531_04240 [Candidatus Falkowbacteria bact
MKKISLIIPCFNEEDGIKYILKSVPSYIDEIVVVDNNSADNTAKVAGQYGARVVFEKQRGYGNAYLSGFKNATGEIFITMDGDGSYSLKDSTRMLGYILNNGIDFVSGCRFPLNDKKSMRILNRFGNWFLTLVFNLLSGRNVKDSQSGMWVFKKEVLDKIKLKSGGMSLSEEIKMEIILHEDIKFLEVPISYNKRVGETKLRRAKDGLLNLFFLVKKRIEIFFRK